MRNPDSLPIRHGARFREKKTWGSSSGLFLAFILVFATPGIRGAGEDGEENREADPGGKLVLETPGLVTFWDFREPGGEPRSGRGRFAGKLSERGGVIKRIDKGVFGPHSAHIDEGRFFEIPRDELGPLDIHGADAKVTVIAWLRRESEQYWQAIAGVWDETHKKRQYMLFLNAAGKTDPKTMERESCRDLAHGHISAVGGPTPGHRVCKTYASGGSPVGFDRWHMLAMTYDGKHIRVYLDGKLDKSAPFNPFPYPEGIFDGGPDGAPFTVGANHVAGVENNNRFGGLVAGLAVFDRALGEEELRMLAEGTLREMER